MKKYELKKSRQIQYVVWGLRARGVSVLPLLAFSYANCEVVCARVWS